MRNTLLILLCLVTLLFAQSVLLKLLLLMPPLALCISLHTLLLQHTRPLLVQTGTLLLQSKLILLRLAVDLELPQPSLGLGTTCILCSKSPYFLFTRLILLRNRQPA